MKKIKCDASLEQEISFGPSFFHRMQRLAKGTAQYKRALNGETDLIGQGGMLLVVSHLLQCQFHVYWWA
jgi:hypothetical protein